MMRVAILPDEAAIGRIGADAVERLYARKPQAVLGLATGSSPLPIYQELIARHRAGRISFARGRAFALDEYVGLSPQHPQSYRQVIRTSIADHVDFPEGAVRGPEGWAEDLDAAAAGYDQAIRDAGGVDLQILGIGADGHIAFNEPGGSLASRTHRGFLTAQTIRDNARFFDGDISQVPTQCLTQGIATIMEARSLVLVATGGNKAEAVRQMVEGAVSASWPATVLQFHPDALVLVDEEAAARLDRADYYREIWDAERN
jgi:glucosamine-6-phosphate deaminase